MNVAPGAYRYAFPPLGIGILLTPIAPVGGICLVMLAGFVLYFHRDPDRQAPDTGLVSPADGTVSVIREEADGRLRVGVYMSVTNVHVNRAPIDGTVESVTHIPGAHRPAFSKDSDRNERVHIEFGTHTVTLIAGAFARRIHPYVTPGTTIERGDRIGHISFGSRADIVLPASASRTDVQVSIGDTVRAGETVLVAEQALTHE